MFSDIALDHVLPQKKFNTAQAKTWRWNVGVAYSNAAYRTKKKQTIFSICNVTHHLNRSHFVTYLQPQQPPAYDVITTIIISTGISKLPQEILPANCFIPSSERVPTLF